MAAEAHEDASEQVARKPQGQWPPERFADLRRRLLIEKMKQNLSSMTDHDAEGLLKCLEYNDVAGRFGWDLNMQALGAARQQPPPQA